MNVCCFCSSSQALPPKYYRTAKIFGEMLVEKKWTLISGGANLGLMKTLIDTVAENNGNSIGIIPNTFVQKGLATSKSNELVITRNLSDRKAELFEISDAFVALPGGFGTLDELLEIITLKQLSFYDKPIVIFNQEEFFSPLIAMFDNIFEQKFAQESTKNSFFVANTVQQIITYIQTITEL